MGNHCTQAGLTNLGTLWDNVPTGREVIITRDKITISDSPRLNIGKSVLANNVKPCTYGQLMVSLSDLQYGEDTDTVLSPKIRVLDPRKMAKSKCQSCNQSQKLTVNRMSIRDDFSAELTAAGVYTNSKQSKEPSKTLENIKSVRDEFIPELTTAGVYTSLTQSKEDLSYFTPETRSEDSGDYSAICSNKTDSLFQLPLINSDGYEFLTEASPTTLFTTGSIAEQDMRDLRNFLKQQGSLSASSLAQSLGSKFEQKVSPTISPKGQRNEDTVTLIRVERKDSPVVKTEAGLILPKKLATQAEQKGMRECHVYFTPRTSAEIWPPLVVTVGEEWDFVKVMRKAIANLQRSMVKGERDGTHDWLYNYNPNKDIRKIKKELKVLFGPKVVSFRNSHLKKTLKDVTSDFINKMWILQKDDKNPKARVRSNTDNNYRGKKESPQSPDLRRHAKPFSTTLKRNSKLNRYERISNRV